MSKIIGIVGRYNANTTNKIYCNTQVIDAIKISGGIPIVLTPDDNLINNYLNICNGIVIPGGNNWLEFDEKLYKQALLNDKSILGICAGMQMMCKFDINCFVYGDNTVLNNKVLNHNDKSKKYVHMVNIKEDTLLYKICGTNKIKVNSRHNYHVPKVNNLVVSAYSEDGLIEAVEYLDKKFVLGIQWHPESMIKYDKYAIKIFKLFIDSCD